MYVKVQYRRIPNFHDLRVFHHLSSTTCINAREHRLPRKLATRTHFIGNIPQLFNLPQELC